MKFVEWLNRKVVISDKPRLEVHEGFFQIAYEGDFLWHLDKKFISWLVAHVWISDYRSRAFKSRGS